MKAVLFLLVLFHGLMAAANSNHISCIYAHDQDGWRPWMLQWSSDNYEIADGEKKPLSGFWTSEKPVLPNYAVCTTMMGTDSEDAVVVDSYKYQADEFDPLDGTSCSLTGKSVRLVDYRRDLVQRGSYVVVETPWVVENIDKIQVREYYPLPEELYDVGAIAQGKCLEIAPTE